MGLFTICRVCLLLTRLVTKRQTILVGYKKIQRIRHTVNNNVYTNGHRDRNLGAKQNKNLTFGEGVSVDPGPLEIIALAQAVRGKAVQHHHEVQLHAIHGNAVSSQEARDQRSRVVHKVVHISRHQLLQTEQLVLGGGLRNAALVAREEHESTGATLREGFLAGGFEAACVLIGGNIAHFTHFREQAYDGKQR